MKNRELMTGSQFLALMERVDVEQVRSIGIPVENPHASIGPSPVVPVLTMHMGNDWDSGTLFIHPQQPLTTLTPEELEEIKKLRSEGQSWVMYKAYERWAREYDQLVDMAIQLRARLLQQGMSMEELIAFAGEAPRKKGRQVKGAK